MEAQVDKQHSIGVGGSTDFDISATQNTNEHDYISIKEENKTDMI